MYPVDLHMHTVASTHAYSTLSDYIAEAHRKGIKLFAITDHGPDMADAPHHWHFINMRIWPRVVNGVGILRGIEANIKNIEGEIDCSGPMFDSLDLIIAGFHEPVFAPHDKETNTQAMIATMASGNVHIISHPEIPNIPSISPQLHRRRQNTVSRWKSIIPRFCIRVRAVKITVALWLRQYVMQVAGWPRFRFPYRIHVGRVR